MPDSRALREVSSLVSSRNGPLQTLCEMGLTKSLLCIRCLTRGQEGQGSLVAVGFQSTVQGVTVRGTVLGSCCVRACVGRDNSPQAFRMVHRHSSASFSLRSGDDEGTPGRNEEGSVLPNTTLTLRFHSHLPSHHSSILPPCPASRYQWPVCVRAGPGEKPQIPHSHVHSFLSSLGKPRAAGSS